MSGAPVTHATSPVMFGREAESARLDRTLEALLDGRAGLVVISGEAGIGKTRLIDEALARASSDLRVLRAECLALGSGIPYLPFAEILRDLARQMPAHRLTHLLGPARAELARFLPEVAVALESDDGRATDTSPAARNDELERLRLYESFLRVTERIAADQATVVVIEDVQWIDRASLELLAFLAHGVRANDQATLIVSVRPEEVEDKERVLTLLAELGRTSNAERIELAPLGTDATSRIAAAMLEVPPDEDLVAYVQSLSDGNPLFAEELLGAWRRRGPGAPLPPKLRDLLAARLAQVPDEVLEVLRVAAAAGRAVDDRLITRASGLEEEQVQRAVRAAVDDYILIRTEGPQRPGYRFRHEILRSLVAAQLLPTEARHIHAAYAEALAEEPPERRSKAELASHWDAAGHLDRALVTHVEAGRDAVATFAFEVACDHFRRALELWSAVDRPETATGWSRAELMSAAASAAARAGAFAEAVTLTRALTDEHPDLDDDVRQLARSSLRWYLWEAGELETALVEAHAVIDDETTPERWRANALGHTAALLLYLQRTEEAAAPAAAARDLATAIGAEEERILAEGLLGWCQLLEGDIDDGLAGLRRAVEGAREAEGGVLEGRYPVGSALAHSQLATALELAGRPEEAREVAIAGSKIAARQGVSRTFGSGLEASAARALYQLGQWDEATDTLERALAGGAVGSGRISLLSVRALIDVGRGRLAEASATVSLADGLVDEHTSLDVRRWLTVAAVELAIWQGDGNAALTRLALAVADAEAPAVAAPGTHPAIPDASVPHLLALGARAVAEVAMAERASGEEPGLSALARSQLETLLRRAERRAAMADVWAGDLALARAELARGEGADPARRAKRWRTAVGLLDDRPYVAAYAGWRLAEAVLAQRDGRKAAAPLIAAALARTDALGAGLLGSELRALARRARLDIGDETGATTVEASGDGARAFGLTERESEVLALLADGLSNQEIAARLFISPKTASVHVSNIYAKLGVESRVAAATMAHEMGLDRGPSAEAAD